jgi:D-arabinose 1-dehydrogenase-like Zn-dependent alcohol dehydrogenase
VYNRVCLVMKAAVMRRAGGQLSLEDAPMPQIGPDEVRVESRTCGICGTDLHILGHEPAGVVVETGRDVTAVRPGDRVVPHLFFSCNACVYCRSGRTQQCANLCGILGVLCPGAFAEYFKIPAENLFVLPDSIPFDAGGLIADAVVTWQHAVRRAALTLGDTAVVLGAGGVGQIIIQLLSASGIQVTAVDQVPEKLRLAREMGAVAGFEPEAVGAFGVQCVFNRVGTPDSMRLAAAMVMQCRRIVVIGEEPGGAPIETTWPTRCVWSRPAPFDLMSPRAFPWSVSTTPSIACAAERSGA